MTSLARLGHLLPRLLLGVVVIVCVLGLAEAGPAAAAPHQPGPVAASAHQDAGAHDGVHAAPARSDAAPEDSGTGGGHAGHGSDAAGGHAMTCMVASGLAAAAFVLPPLAGDGVALAVPPAPRLASELPAALQPRPPDLLRTLCIQRT